MHLHAIARDQEEIDSVQNLEKPDLLCVSGLASQESQELLLLVVLISRNCQDFSRNSCMNGNILTFFFHREQRRKKVKTLLFLVPAFFASRWEIFCSSLLEGTSWVMAAKNARCVRKTEALFRLVSNWIKTAKSSIMQRYAAL